MTQDNSYVRIKLSELTSNWSIQNGMDIDNGNLMPHRTPNIVSGSASLRPKTRNRYRFGTFLVFVVFLSCLRPIKASAQCSYSATPWNDYIAGVSFGGIDNVDQGDATKSGASPVGYGDYADAFSPVELFAGDAVATTVRIVSRHWNQDPQKVVVSLWAISEGSTGAWNRLGREEVAVINQMTLPGDQTDHFGSRYQIATIPGRIPSTLAGGTYRFRVTMDRRLTGAYPCEGTQGEAEDYRLIISSGSGTDTGTDTVAYTAPTVDGTPYNSYIASVELGNVSTGGEADNRSINTNPIGYRYYGATSIDLVRGETYAGGVAAFTDHYNQIESGTAYVGVWVDLNGNGTYGDTPAEVALLEAVEIRPASDGGSAAEEVVPFVVAPIEDGYTGAARMRVIFRLDQLPTPTDEGFYGEIEDYAVQIRAPALGNLPTYTKLEQLPGSYCLQVDSRETFGVWFNHRYAAYGSGATAEYTFTNLETGVIDERGEIPLRRGVNKHTFRASEIGDGNYLLKVEGVDLDEDRFLKVCVGFGLIHIPN